MRWKILISASLISAVASAQVKSAHPVLVVTPAPINACELTCSCKPVPGEVNRCSGYWTLKQVPIGKIVQVVNPDPAACVKAVDDNVSTLSAYYGRAPEASLPTKELATKATTFTLPAPAPLAFSHLLDAATAVAPEDPLEKRIGAQTARVKALTDDARSYATLKERLTQWQLATAAANRLASRTQGAEKALSLATPWPKLKEFAPDVWKLEICAHSKPAEVKALDDRIQNQSDIAWYFAFMDDWLVLQGAFDSNSGKDTTGTSRFESIARPFFGSIHIAVRRAPRWPKLPALGPSSSVSFTDQPMP